MSNKKNGTHKSMSPGRIIRNQKGFTMMELLTVIAIMAILLVVALSSLRSSNEKIACKNIYSAFQTAKMGSISSGYDAYVDFDMNEGLVSNGFYTVYLDTDDDAVFGETSNANGENEFTESNFAMPDTSGGFPGVALPDGVAFGKSSTMNTGPTGGTIPSDGVTATNERIKFNSEGAAAIAGSVYVYNTDTTNPQAPGCAVIAGPTGIIRLWNWNGSTWN